MTLIYSQYLAPFLTTHDTKHLALDSLWFGTIDAIFFVFNRIVQRVSKMQMWTDVMVDFFPSSLFCLCLSLPCIPRCLWPTGAADRSKTDGWGTSFNHCCDMLCPRLDFVLIIIIIQKSTSSSSLSVETTSSITIVTCFVSPPRFHLQNRAWSLNLVPRLCFARLFVPPPVCCATTF